MAVDYRLRDYFSNARLFHKTGETLWLQMLATLAEQGTGPGPRAAQALIARHKQRRAANDSG